MRKSECGLRQAQAGQSRKKGRRQIEEFGSRTRRRPIGQDYAAAKDAAIDELRRAKSEKGQKTDRGIRPSTSSGEQSRTRRRSIKAELWRGKDAEEGKIAR